MKFSEKEHPLLTEVDFWLKLQATELISHLKGSPFKKKKWISLCVDSSSRANVKAERRSGKHNIQEFGDAQENVRHEDVLVDFSWILHYC